MASPGCSQASPASSNTLASTGFMRCIVAILLRDKRFHIAFVAVALVYQISFILRLFDTIV